MIDTMMLLCTVVVCFTIIFAVAMVMSAWQKIAANRLELDRECVDLDKKAFEQESLFNVAEDGDSEPPFFSNN